MECLEFYINQIHVKTASYRISTNTKEGISYNLTALSSSNSNNWQATDNVDNLVMH